MDVKQEQDDDVSVKWCLIWLWVEIYIGLMFSHLRFLQATFGNIWVGETFTHISQNY